MDDRDRQREGSAAAEEFAAVAPDDVRNSGDAPETENPQSSDSKTGRNPLDALVDWCKGLLPPPPVPHTSAVKSDRLTVVTLHFEETSQCCVAVLSKPAHGLCSVYFQCRIEQGTCRQHSDLYYELDGFVRQQLLQLQRALHPHSVHLAVGALEASDNAQQKILQEQYRRNLERKHSRTKRLDSLDENVLLAQVFEIACLHRLGDDLDFLSLYCLARANSLCRNAAGQMLRHKRRYAKIVVTPYVDGSKELGYSSITRDDESNLVQQIEAGQSVIYRKCAPVLLHGDSESYDKYKPVNTQQPFSWKCQEVALAQIHSWWIAECEYVGQKLIIEWHTPCSPGQSIILDRMRLEAGPRKGAHVWRTAKTAVTLNVRRSQTRALDNVTLSYSGEAQIVDVQIPLMTLVGAEAKLEWDRLRKDLAHIQQSRPLLSHEVEYCRIVQELMGSF